MKLLKNISIIVWMGLVLIALFFVLHPLITRKPKVIVSSVLENSPCRDVITEGSIITEIAGRRIRSSDDFFQITKNLKGAITLIIDGNPKSCTIPPNSTLNVSVRDVEPKWLKFGVDVKGGTRILLKPEEKSALKQALSTIRSRIKEYEISNIMVRQVGNSIQIITSLEDEGKVKKIIGQGIFEAKLMETIEFKNGVGELVLGNTTYEMVLENTSIMVNKTEYKTGQGFMLEGLRFEVENITENRTIIFVNVFDDRDVINVLTGSDYSRIVKQDSGYVFVFGIQLSEGTGRRFSRVTKGREVVISPTTGESFLKDPLVLSIDGETVVELPINGVDVGKEKTDLIIWGYKVTAKEARDEMLRMISVLRTKRLVTGLEITEISSVSPVLGKTFIDSIVFMILTVFSFASVVALVRYQRLKIVLLMVLMGLSEIILILGVVSSQFFVFAILLCAIGVVVVRGELYGWINWLTVFLMFIVGFGVAINEWVLDISTLIGLVGMIIIEIGQTFFITDQVLLQKKDVSASKRNKLVLKNMWKSTSIIIVALMPLFFFSSMLKGFVTISVIGTMIGIAITKPVYAILLEETSE